tara:strand:+ start:8113 stop:8397 length:285 start_codon:yes stop_codon:yes gene_type:complete
LTVGRPLVDRWLTIGRPLVDRWYWLQLTPIWLLLYPKKVKYSLKLKITISQMKKNKYPRWFRIIRYNFNCLWYHIIFPLGLEVDDFTKQWNKRE